MFGGEGDPSPPARFCESLVNLQALLFIVGFIVILMAFIYFIARVARRFNGNVSQRTYSAIEGAIIAGLLLGVVGRFQPGVHLACKIDLSVLLLSTLAYIVWSHVTPKSAHNGE